MHKKLVHCLNRSFPLFLAHRKGRIYFIWMMIILVLLINLLQPFGLINIHEFHKPLLLADYILVYYGTYAVLYMILSYLSPQHYQPDSWIIKKEFCALLYCIPVTAGITYLFADISVPEFELSLSSFFRLQFYNSLLSAVSIPVFGYFVDTRLNPATITRRRKRKENTGNGLNLSKEKARDIQQKLHQLMETEQLYLNNKCSIQLVATHSGISVHYISYAINTYPEHNFNDFVNKYRVEHACRVLQNGPDKKLKLEAIGYQCGFGSKVNFYAAFRKFTGTTPAEYLAEWQARPKLNN